ncbi:MAG: YebC/PmpR family DNA-binding transcriptional regulator [Verrucomicrobia bacterium]|nr:YebC/PmpR family DNA-binding transcriptional regulator [Verrucomicrobiota bacterium]
MSGHSKWKTIQHKKNAADAKRGKIFSKLSKELMLVAKSGGSDPVTNVALRTLIQKAKSYNMPSDNIERAVKKGAGELEGASYEDIVYEGYVGGVAVIIQVLTDNRNRATAEIRHTFTRHNASIATQGACLRGFERKGQIFVDATIVDEDKLMGIVVEAGADDMSGDGTQYEILVAPALFTDVTDALEKAKIPTLSAEVTMLPMAPMQVSDAGVAGSILKFVSDLEDSDDVQNVYTNMDMTDEVLQAIAAKG